MAVYNLSLLWYAAGVFVAYKIFWSLFGLSILKVLYPSHYAVWAGAKQPPTAGPLTVIQGLPRTWRLIAAGADFLDDIVCAGFARRGWTMRSFGLFGYTTYTSDPQNIQALLATQFKDFTTGRLRRQWLFPALGDSIFTSEGSFWEHSRALFRPQFSRDNINNLEYTDQASDALIAACGYTDSAGWTSEVALSPLFFNFTLDTATEFLFGQSLNTQETAVRKARGEHVDAAAEALSTSSRFLEAYDLIQGTLMQRIRFANLYWLADGPRFRAATKFIKDWTEHFAQLALNSPQQKGEGKQTNLLATLARECKDPSELRNQTLSILFAGRDTTASLLGWMFMRLSLHADVYDKLRKIVVAEFPPGKDISFASLKACRYLQHVIQESLRLHPTVPFNLRVAVRDTTLPTGGGPDGKSPIPVRKGEFIPFSVYVMHRRKDLWGEDVLDFNPDRWEQKIPAWQYLPFSGGPRICLGMQLAIVEASYVLVRMVREFDKIEPVDWDEMKKMRKNVGITMSVQDPVRVRLHKAA